MLGDCIVFGGSGWTGSFLISQLVALSQQADCISNNTSMKVYSVDIREPLECLKRLHIGETGFELCDITNEGAVKELLERINPQTIFHTAAIVDLRQYPSPLLEKVNVDGTFFILNHFNQEKELKSSSRKENMEEKKFKYLIYTSSIDVVSSRQGAMGADETTPYILHPSNHYKRTKIIAEKAVLEANNRLCNNHRTVLYTCALRPGHIFGPADILLPLTVLPIALGPPSARMSFTYVENCARAHILAAQKLVEESTMESFLKGKKHIENNCNESNKKVIMGSSLAEVDCQNKLAGKALFVCDFDTNFGDTYRRLGGHGPILFRIPNLVAKVVVSIAEYLESFFFQLFGIQIITHPITGISNAMLECCGDHTVHSGLAAKLFHHDASL